MVGVHEVKARAGVDVSHERDRHVVEPDVFGERVAAAVALRQEMARLVIDELRGPGRRHVLGRADGEALEAVVNVAVCRHCPEDQRRQAAAIVIGVIVGGQAAAVGDQVAGAVVAEGAHRGCALRQRGELIVAAGIVVGVAVAGAGGQRFRGAVADAIIGPVQRAPDAFALLQPIRRGIDIGLATRRVHVVGDSGDVDAIAERIGTADHHVRGGRVLNEKRADQVILSKRLGEDQAVAIGERAEGTERHVRNGRRERNRRARRALLRGDTGDPPECVAAVSDDPPGRIGDLRDVILEIVGVADGVSDASGGLLFLRDSAKRIVGPIDRPRGIGDLGQAADAIIAAGCGIPGVADVLGGIGRILLAEQPAGVVIGQVGDDASAIRDLRRLAERIVGIDRLPGVRARALRPDRIATYRFSSTVTRFHRGRHDA